MQARQVALWVRDFIASHSCQWSLHLVKTTAWLQPIQARSRGHCGKSFKDMQVLNDSGKCFKYLRLMTLCMAEHKRVKLLNVILVSLSLTLMSSRLSSFIMENLLTPSTMLLCCSAYVRVDRSWTHFLPHQKWWVFCGEQRRKNKNADNVTVISRTCDLAQVPFPPTQRSYQYCLCPQHSNSGKLGLVTEARHWSLYSNAVLSTREMIV